MKLELTMDQQLLLRIYSDKAKNIPQDQLAKLLRDLMRQIMVNDTLIKTLFQESMRGSDEICKQEPSQ